MPLAEKARNGMRNEDMPPDVTVGDLLVALKGSEDYRGPHSETGIRDGLLCQVVKVAFISEHPS